MSDLIQRLRAGHVTHHCVSTEGAEYQTVKRTHLPPAIQLEAAAEIERLEKMAESRYAEKRDLVAEVAVALVDAGVSRFGYLKEGVEKLAEKLSSAERQRDEATKRADEAIAALRGEWVAVSERLPMLEPVLGVFAGGSQMVVILDVIEGWQDAETREELLQAPTHWKPLSEPPESARRLLNQKEGT